MLDLGSAGREREPDTYVPYVGHASSGVLLLDNGDTLAMLRLGGMAWETAEADAINTKQAQLNIVLRTIASERLVLSSHVVRITAEPGLYL